MKAEIYKRAIQINERISQLRNVAKELYSQNKCCYALTFANVSFSSGTPLAIDETKRAILGNFLEKHQKMIYSEIAEEIRELEKEIETL